MRLPDSDPSVSFKEVFVCNSNLNCKERYHNATLLVHTKSLSIHSGQQWEIKKIL